MELDSNIYDVIVVGGGVAGLTAAHKLRETGVTNLLVLESEGRLGGRTLCREGLLPWPVDLGAEFIHGGGDFYDFCTQHNIQLERTFCSFPPEPYFDDGRPVSEDKLVDWVTGQREDADLAMMIGELRGLSSLPASVDDEFPRASLYEWLVSRGVKQRMLSLADAVYAKTWATDLSEMSLAATRREALIEDTQGSPDIDNYILARGTGELLRVLSASLHVKLRHRVTSVDFCSSSSSSPAALLCENGARFSARRVLVAAPLQEALRMNVCPPVPSSLSSGLRLAAAGPAVKLICCFSRRFWPEHMLLVFCSDSAVSQVWMDPPRRGFPEAHSVTGYITGLQAARMMEQPAWKIVDTFCRQLDAMFRVKQDRSPASDSFQDHMICKWSAAYSHPTVPGNTQRSLGSRGLLGGRLFFAGEHCPPEGEMATVTAAMHSGAHAAGLIKAKL